jgi:hypothetical protein
MINGTSEVHRGLEPRYLHVGRLVSRHGPLALAATKKSQPTDDAGVLHIHVVRSTFLLTACHIFVYHRSFRSPSVDHVLPNLDLGAPWCRDFRSRCSPPSAPARVRAQKPAHANDMRPACDTIIHVHACGGSHACRRLTISLAPVAIVIAAMTKNRRFVGFGSVGCTIDVSPASQRRISAL